MAVQHKRQKREEYRRMHKEEGASTQLPKKKFYRQRAHANPFSDHMLTYPVSPAHMQWWDYFPAYIDHHAKPRDDGLPTPLTEQITIADIGCGFGGLLVALSPMLPNELILGLEIRAQVADYVQDRISALRAQHALETNYRKIAFPNFAIRNNDYVKLPSIPSGGSSEAEEYVITSNPGLDQKTVEETESLLKSFVQAEAIPSFDDNADHVTRWVLHLTKSQAKEIQISAHICSVEENDTMNHENSGNIETTYYNPLTKSVSSDPVPTPYSNISVLRANTMKFLPNFFHRAQLTHIFLCFPDPHFKARKHKARIVSSTLCAEYAYVLRPGGCVYTITDVEELGNWMWERFAEFGKGDDGIWGPLFENVAVPEEGKEREWIDEQDSQITRDKELAGIVRCIREETEEGKKVSRNKGKKFVSVWRRRENPKWPDEE